MADDELNRLTEAVQALQGLYVSHDVAEEIQRDIRTLHMRKHKSGEAGIVFVEGETRSGKSQILRDYAEMHPDEPRAIVRANGEVADRKPVIYMRMPDATEKNVTEKWLATLTNQRSRDVGGRGNRRYDIQEDILYVAGEVENRVALLDEAHQCIHSRDDTKTARIAVLLKDVVNAGVFSLAIAGTREARRLFDANPELEARVLYEHVLEPCDWDNPAGRGLLMAILETWDEHLRESVFGKSSGLTEPGTAWAINLASRGYIGIAANLVESAGVAAVHDMLAGKADRLTLAHLRAAFRKTPQWRKAPRAFDTSLPGESAKPADAGTPSREVQDEVDGIQTRLRGRTRRTDRHRIFRP